MNPTPQNTLIIIMAHHGAPGRKLGLWLNDRAREGYAIDYGSPEYGIDVARNQNCNRFLMQYAQHAQHEYFVMIDRDIVPLAETMPLLTTEADLVYCGYCSKGGTKHYGSNDFGAGCFKVSREALNKITKPWFKFGIADTHDLKTQCECNYFQQRARAAGIVPTMVGIAGHEQTVTLIPGAQGIEIRE